MAMLKHQLAGSLSEKTLTIEEKIKLLDANKKIGKVADSSLINFALEDRSCKKY